MSILKRGTKRFIAGMIMAGVFVLLPSVFNFIADSIRVSYYTNVASVALIRDIEIQVENMCLGEKEQLWIGTRDVGLKDGISANLTRELYRIVELEGRGQVKAKIREETADIFIDPITNSSRIQTYDPPLDVGEYVWQLKFNELYLPAGVVRIDTPVVRTNIFQVTDCTYDPIQ